MGLDRDVQGTLRGGKKITGELFSLYYSMRDATAESRLALRVPKAAGNAPLRNRMKRLAREAFRLNQGRFKAPLDLVILFRPSPASKEIKFSQMETQLVRMLGLSGLLT